MDQQEALKLLSRPESETLEFKREGYLLNHGDRKVKSRQRDEMIKDILALANGSTITAGETAYLIIGADEIISENSQQTLYDIGDYQLDSTRILNIVNAACEPAIESITSETVEINGKMLLFVTIPPTPHLHETTRMLVPKSGRFHEYSVFVRQGEGIHLASQKERETILRMKRFHFEKNRRPPPVLFGLGIGGFIGSVMLYVRFDNADKASNLQDTLVGRIVAGFTGLFVGGFLGGTIGNMYRDWYEIRSGWHNVPKQMRLPLIVTSLLTGIGAAKTLSLGFGILLKLLKRTGSVAKHL